MENRNPLIRLSMYGKLKKMMKGFSSKNLEPLERNLFRGLFIRKLKDFSETQKEMIDNKSLLERLREDMKIRPT
jgi:hypothetical protein